MKKYETRKEESCLKQNQEKWKWQREKEKQGKFGTRMRETMERVKKDRNEERGGKKG